MYKVYIIVNSKSDTFYIGVTSNSLNSRMSSHAYSCRSGKTTKLYDAMRYYGIDSFSIKLLEEFDSRKQAENREVELIGLCFENNIDIYNLAKGGTGGFVIQDVTSWKSKLSSARQGRKPALGMKHSDSNKEKFAACSREYWDSQNTYSAEDILKLGFTEANKKFGISKTHYYRLRRQAKNNELG